MVEEVQSMISQSRCFNSSIQLRSIEDEREEKRSEISHIQKKVTKGAKIRIVHLRYKSTLV